MEREEMRKVAEDLMKALERENGGSLDEYISYDEMLRVSTPLRLYLALGDFLVEEF